MNAVRSEKFLPEDIELLNELFGKLGQAPAQLIAPKRFEAIPPDTEVEGAVSPVAARQRGLCFTLELLEVGVSWRTEVLKKARVRGCGADFVMLERAKNDPLGARFVERLGGRVTAECRLHPSDIEGFLDIFGLRDRGNDLLELIVQEDPDHDFAWNHVAAGDDFDGELMTIEGGASAGQRCKVVEVIHRGLQRKSDRRWKIKALVRIRNVYRHER